MSSLVLPDLSRLTLHTDGISETNKGKFRIPKAPGVKAAKEDATRRAEEAARRSAKQAERRQAELERYMRIDSDRLNTNEYKRQLEPAHVFLERAQAYAVRLTEIADKNELAQMATEAAEFAAGIAASAEQYRQALDKLEKEHRKTEIGRRWFAKLKGSTVWTESIDAYVGCLSDAALVLENLAATIEAEMISTEELPQQTLTRMLEDLMLLLSAEDSDAEWSKQLVRYSLYQKLRKRARRDAFNARALMADFPSTPLARSLWLQDLLNVIKEGQKTQVTGTLPVSVRLKQFRAQRGRSNMTEKQMDAALETPELSKPMQVVHDLITDEMERLKRYIDENRMGAGEFVRVDMDFSEFGLGNALVQYNVTQSERETRPRANLSIKWFLEGGSKQAMVKQLLADVRPRLHISQEGVLRSELELKRFLHYLYKHRLSAVQQAEARTWSKSRPRAPPAIERSVTSE